MGIPNGDIGTLQDSTGSFLHHHLPCIISLGHIETRCPIFFSQSELRNSSRERLETVGQLLCTGACTSALQGWGLYNPCGSWIPWPMFQAIFARCTVLQTQSARGCKKQTHQQDTDLAGLVNWLGDECCIILSKNVKDGNFHLWVPEGTAHDQNHWVKNSTAPLSWRKILRNWQRKMHTTHEWYNSS